MKWTEVKGCHTLVVKRKTNAVIAGRQIEEQVSIEKIDAFNIIAKKKAIPCAFKIAKRFSCAHKDWWFRVSYHEEPSPNSEENETWVSIVVTIGKIPNSDTAEVFVSSMYMPDGTKIKIDKQNTGKEPETKLLEPCEEIK